VKKVFLLVILLFLSLPIFSQDIVYDSLIGNRNYWRRIKIGPNEKILNTYFQNTGIISKSKILMAAGIWDGIVENVDYKLQPLNYDTITFEYKSNEPLNLIFYRYQYNENYHFNFLGLRKAFLGDDMFTGKYLFVCPVDTAALVSIYKGIGSNRKLFMSFKGSDMNDPGYTYTDYNVVSDMTVRVIHGQRRIMHAIIQQLIIDENDFENRVVIWPNPVSTYLNIKILENTGVIFRMYDLNGIMRVEQQLNEENTLIDVSSLVSGTYVLVFSDYNFGNILYTSKIIVIRQ
jgi:hypothetical protein